MHFALLAAHIRYTYQVYQVPNTVSAATSFRANLPTPTTDFAGTVGVHKFLMWADMGTDQYNTLWHFGNVDNAKALGARVKSLIDADPAIGLITHVGDLSYGCKCSCRSYLYASH